MLDVMKSMPVALKTWLAVTMLSMLIISCSTSTPPTVVDDPPVEPLVQGVAVCYLCHYPDDAIDQFAGMDIVEKWRNGPHGNNETITITHAKVDNHPDNTGYPYFVGDSGLGTDTACTPGLDCPPVPDCTRVCHDQLGDGELLEDAALDFIGLVNRPIVGCESCHGEAGDHAGSVGLVSPEFPRPDPDRCGQCHNSDFEHNLYTPEGDNIYEDYITSAHAVSISDPHYVVYATPPDVQALCSKCHTDEGARLYKDISGGHDALEAALDGLDPVVDATVVQCRTCHNPHDPSELLFEESGGQSAEYHTCSNCHQNDGSFGLADGYHGENNGHSWSDGFPDFTVGVPPFLPEEIIYDTHFDDPATVNAIEGYNLGPITNDNYGLASERVCRDCHNVHAAGSIIDTIVDETINNINKQWAKSAHSGHIAEAKEAADASDPQNILDAAVEDGSHNSPFAHYDWDDTNNVAGTPPDKDVCQRCHTATGAKNYLDDPASYDPLKNDFSHLEGWTWVTPATKDDGNATTSGQNELLYCWGCHADNSGTLRDPGAVTAEYPSVPFVYPDLSGSNVCIACHAGRESGDNIQDSADDFNNKEFVNSHNLAAGGIIFIEIGYEFTGQDYSNPIPYQHDDATLLGDNGPCVGCHMKTDTSHLFLPVEKDGGGTITALTTYDETCSICHNGVDETEPEMVTLLNDLATGYEAALDALKAELDSAGFFFFPSYPYFFKGLPPIFPNWLTDWDPLDNGSGKDNMGAAFNYYLLYHEPGAYVHNLQYSKKLIYDSIDYLDDATFNSSVEATLGGSGDAYDFLVDTRP